MRQAGHAGGQKSPGDKVLISGSAEDGRGRFGRQQAARSGDPAHTVAASPSDNCAGLNGPSDYNVSFRLFTLAGATLHSPE